MALRDFVSRFVLVGEDRTGRAFANVDKGLVGLEKRAIGLAKTFAATGAALATGGFFKYAITSSANFEASLSELSAITGATGKDLQYLGKQAQQFGATTTLSASEAVEALKLVGSAKPDLLENAAALSAVTKEAITLAEAAGTTLPQAATTLGSALNQFNAGAEEASRFINVLAAGAKFGAAEIPDTAAALEKAGTVAAAAGISFEETNAAIQSLAGISLKGADAGTALRTVFLRLQTQTNDQFNPAVVGLTAALQNMREAGLSTTDMVDLFGREGLVAGQRLIDQASSVATLTKQITGTHTAYAQAEVRVDNLKGDVKQLSSAFEALSIKIGNEMNPSARGLVGTLTDITAAFGGAIDGTAEANEEFGKLDFFLKAVSKIVFRVSKEFTDLGDVLGNTAAAWAALLQGNWEGVKEIANARAETRAEMEKEIQLFNDRLDFGEAALGTEQAITQELLKQNTAGAGGENRPEAETAGEQLARQEQEKRREQLEKALADIDELLMTEEEKVRASYAQRLSDVQAALDAKIINEAQAIDTIAALEQERDAKLDQLRTERQLKDEEAQQQKLQRLMQGLEMEDLLERQRWEQQQEFLAEAFEQKLVTEAERDAIFEQLKKEHEDKLTEIAKKGMTDRERFQNMSWGQQVGTVAGALEEMTAGVANSNKTMFKLNKAAGIANAIVNTATGVTRALAEYPPPISFVMAAAQLAAGLAQINAIKSTQFGGGTTPSVAGSTPTYNGQPTGGGASGATGTALNASGDNGGEGGGNSGNSRRVDVTEFDEDNIYSGRAVRKLLERIDEELGDGFRGKHIRIRTRSRA